MWNMFNRSNANTKKAFFKIWELEVCRSNRGRCHLAGLIGHRSGTIVMPI